MTRYVGAVDQGTTSTRFMVFDHAGREVARHQLEHAQILAQAGWVEHDPIEIYQRVCETIEAALAKANLTAQDLAAVGVTNQRETTVIWNPKTGAPLYNAIVWQDMRTDGIMRKLEQSGAGEMIRRKTGLPPATYFSAGKIQWILENVDGARSAARRGKAIFGNIDTWLIWNLTGGINGGAHITDVTNASRTMLFNLETLDWDDELLGLFSIPRSMLPAVRPSSDARLYGLTQRTGPFKGEVPLCADLGDQQAATVGQVCFSPGEAKNTYGTGNFMLLNTGTNIVPSHAGLLTTVGYQFGRARPVYALEGSVAVTGSAVQWLRDQLGLIKHASDIEALANTVADNGGVYFVPAFSGLYAPHWRADARLHRRAHALQRQRSSRPSDARSHLLSNARCTRRDGEGFRRKVGSLESRWWRNHQRYAHATPSRYFRCARGTPGRFGNHRARGGLCCWTGCRFLARCRRDATQLASRQAVGTALERRPERGRIHRLGESHRAHLELD
jgi:glycerol kinase